MMIRHDMAPPATLRRVTFGKLRLAPDPFLLNGNLSEWQYTLRADAAIAAQAFPRGQAACGLLHFGTTSRPNDMERHGQ
jgi:hypothetical protein